MPNNLQEERSQCRHLYVSLQYAKNVVDLAAAIASAGGLEILAMVVPNKGVGRYSIGLSPNDMIGVFSELLINGYTGVELVGTTLPPHFRRASGPAPTPPLRGTQIEPGRIYLPPNFPTEEPGWPWDRLRMAVGTHNYFQQTLGTASSWLTATYDKEMQLALMIPQWVFDSSQARSAGNYNVKLALWHLIAKADQLRQVVGFHFKELLAPTLSAHFAQDVGTFAIWGELLERNHTGIEYAPAYKWLMAHGIEPVKFAEEQRELLDSLCDVNLISGQTRQGALEAFGWR